ncbi:hypothetical protein COV06_02000 [Candidatus Uhrbacteria bacterium CG10_big_fil_rev_8_21_14_0_10_50_16]|uniref:D-alanine--D-alanine ligase n=1 Tax=Candidatus Uhrbacteria bacterium CG10_big_fil_rev_8_21_14_0_10_50_16 TaxID=1975039 RepID=A0A2H0RPQ7_9BACT|nr:MAG: hypothetical protein COV06_02000 [Candidatus Uhrbacteria bacterium CG10_big_fil_rev_8_21_14_0_10_50_16]
MPNKKTIAVIFGGKSAEHDVSIITAHTPIIQSLVAMGKYNILPIYVTKDGDWYSDEAMNDMAYFRKGGIEGKLKKLKPLQLSLGNALSIIFPGIIPKTVKVDIVFPAMHGTFGEDGSLMGVLRMANVPFVGCDLAASAVAMDKVFTKQIAEAEGIPVVPYVWFTKQEWLSDMDVCIKKTAGLTWPLFVKPVHLGSSIAITKVKNQTELKRAIEVAFHYDDKVLVEESVDNLIEVTLPIMGNDQPQVASIERPLNKTEFFNFEDKYLSGGKKGSGGNSAYSEVPAKISSDLAHKVEELGKQVYRVLGCTGTARVDFLINSKREHIFVNEVNTLPGSLYHHNWKMSGVSNIDLVRRLIELGEEKFLRESTIVRVFKSNVLHKD